MRIFLRSRFAIVATCLALGCSSGTDEEGLPPDTGTSDGSSSPGSDAGQGSQDAGNNDSGIVADSGIPRDAGPPPPGPTLRVQDGLSFCAQEIVLSGDLDETKDARYRVTLSDEWIRLPEEGASTTVPLFADGKFGVEQTNIEALAEATLTTGDFGNLWYRFSQDIRLGDKNRSLSLLVRASAIESAGGSRILVSDDFFSEDIARLTFADGFTSFIDCAFSGYSWTVEDFEFENGDSVHFDLGRVCPPEFSCKADQSNVLQAALSLGEDERQIKDYFSLSHEMLHHNWGQRFTFWLDVPVGPVHGVHVETQSSGGPRSGTITYLADDASSVDTSALTVHRSVPK